MKKSILLFVLMTVVTFAFASRTVPVEDAKLVSKNFITEISGNPNFQLSDFTLVHTETDENGESLYYCFQIRDYGFIMVSATSLAHPILGFTFEENFTDNNNNYFMLKHSEELSFLKKNPGQAKNHSAAWNRYSSPSFVPNQSKDGNVGVEPLLTTTWSQEKYYNTYCPFDSRPSETGTSASRDYRAYNGCVAVNLTNLMFYHRWPESGNSGISYIPIDYDVDPPHIYPRQTVNFAQNTYNYNTMYEGSLNTYVNELAKLFYHAGVSVNMSYGNNGSGSNSLNAVDALKANWKMDQFLYNLRKDDLSTNAFIDSMVTQLDKNLPLYFSATIGGEDGHAFMIDGYMEIEGTIYFHSNFGWGGYKNGYYLLGNIDGYNQDESILMNVIPNTDDIDVLKPLTSTDTITATLGTISDGSGAYKYQPNTNRSWLFNTPGATKYTFNFSKIKTEANGDIITIYNGPTVASGVKAQFSGNYLMKSTNDAGGLFQSVFTGDALPGPVVVNGSSVLVTFTSNSNDITDYGFVMNYNVTTTPVPQMCSGVVIYPGTEINGVISDKALSADDDVNYGADKECQFIGRNFTYVDRFAMAFTKFDLMAGDFVDVWDITNQNIPQLVQRFDINNMPNGAFYVNSGKFQVNFVSDNWKQGTGFKLEYYAIVGIPGNSGLDNVNVYPNPVSGNLNVAITTELNETMHFQIFDMAGKMISSESAEVSGDYVYTTSVNHLATGIYMMHINTSKGKSVHKFIVE